MLIGCEPISIVLPQHTRQDSTYSACPKEGRRREIELVRGAESGVRERVTRADVCRQHGAHAAQQKSCRRRRSTHLAGAEGAENRVQDENVESNVFAPVLCAWCGEGTGKLSGCKLRTWARDTGCAVRGRLLRHRACSGGAVARRGVARTRSGLAGILFRSKREDSRLLSMSYRLSVSTPGKEARHAAAEVEKANGRVGSGDIGQMRSTGVQTAARGGGRGEAST